MNQILPTIIGPETEQAAVFQPNEDGGYRVFYDLDALVEQFLGPLTVKVLTLDSDDETSRVYLMGFRDAIDAIHKSIPVLIQQSGLV